MRFDEAYDGWCTRRLTQEEAAQLLGVCDRTFRRYIDRYEEEGLEGLADKRLAQVSHYRAHCLSRPSCLARSVDFLVRNAVVAGVGVRW